MGRIGDLGWAVRDRLSGTVVAVVLALAGLGAGVAGIVIALDAKNKAEDAAATTAPVSAPVTTAPDSGSSAEIDELHERVAAIEESVSQLHGEQTEATPSEGAETTPTPEETTTPETPELPEGLEVPGVPEAGSSSPP